MNRVAFAFTHGPHGNAVGREGLDALLAMSILAENIGVFFIADGVLLMMLHQQPEQILTRNFIITFGVVTFYGINHLYLCANSAIERGLSYDADWVLDVKCLQPADLRQKLSDYDAVLTF